MVNLAYFLRYEFSHRFDPYNDYLKQAVRTALACLLAVVLYRVLPQYNQAYWAILSAAFLIQTRVGKTASEQLLSMSLCGLLAACVAVLAIFAAFNTLVLALYIALLGVIVVFISAKGHNPMVRIFFIVLFAIISAGLPMQGSVVWERGLFIVVGSMLGVLCGLLWLEQPNKIFIKALRLYFHAVAEFVYQQIQLILHDASEEKLEARLHERRNRLLRQLNYLRKLSAQLNLPEISEKLLIAEKLWMTSLAFGNLRYLLTDQGDSLKDNWIYAGQQLLPTLQMFMPHKYLKISSSESAKPLNQDLVSFYTDQLSQLFDKAYRNVQ